MFVTVDRPPFVDALGLGLTVLALAGPAGTACIVACLTAAASRSRQSFGARAVVAAPDHPAGLERALFEALMVRWSMTTPVAERAWVGMQADGGGRHGPNGALEHALWTFHAQDSLRHWLDQLRPTTTSPEPTKGEGDVAAVLADHTEGDSWPSRRPSPRWLRRGVWSSESLLPAPGGCRSMSREPARGLTPSRKTVSLDTIVSIAGALGTVLSPPWLLPLRGAV